MTPFKISVLVFLRDAPGRLLLIKRRKAPNLGCWSPIGGKLEMARGESPFECAIRETAEEVGLAVTEKDLHLFGYISEKNYEGGGHWLMFLFDCKKILPDLPPTGDEGEFAFFPRGEIDALPIPPTDQVLVWPWYDQHRGDFVAIRADCAPGEPLNVVVEQIIRGD
jgi:8-oxo-dGTP diphosphatase